MAIKSCKKRIATRCFGTQTIQPFGSNAYIQWTCPECGKMLQPQQKIIESIDLTTGGKDVSNRPTDALRSKRTASGR